MASTMDNGQWLERERAVLASWMQRSDDPMFGPVVVRGQGSRVWDIEGNAYFDLTCGYSAANFGHAFPPLIAAATRQLYQLTHLTGMSHPGRCELAQRLVQYCGQPDDRVVFNTSGARAIETAIKIALAAKPGRIVSIGSAYHGRSLTTAELSDTAAVGLKSMLPGLLPAEHPQFLIERRPFTEWAYCTACPWQLSYPSCQLACENSLLEWLTVNADTISAVIVEPALGARGYIQPPIEYLLRLRAATARAGIRLIADEIQMGLGRCGHWLLSRQQGWLADLIVLGKSLGGGITPISAVIGRRELVEQLPRGIESETFAASPLGTAIGCEVVDQLANGPWFERATLVAATLKEQLTPFPAMIETLGASVTLEYLQRGRDPQVAATLARDTAVAFRQAGLIVHYSGPLATRIVFLPALTISDQELQEVCQRIRSAR